MPALLPCSLVASTGSSSTRLHHREAWQLRGRTATAPCHERTRYRNPPPIAVLNSPSGLHPADDPPHIHARRKCPRWRLIGPAGVERGAGRVWWVRSTLERRGEQVDASAVLVDRTEGAMRSSEKSTAERCRVMDIARWLVGKTGRSQRIAALRLVGTRARRPVRLRIASARATATSRENLLDGANPRRFAFTFRISHQLNPSHWHTALAPSCARGRVLRARVCTPPAAAAVRTSATRRVAG